MSKIVALPQSAPNPEESLHWSIMIDPELQDLTWVCVNEGQWWLSIHTNSFERLPALKKDALKKLKIAKATTKGGGSD